MLSRPKRVITATANGTAVMDCRVTDGLACYFTCRDRDFAAGVCAHGLELAPSPPLPLSPRASLSLNKQSVIVAIHLPQWTWFVRAT
jgi:hypothetical protein